MNVAASEDFVKSREHFQRGTTSLWKQLFKRPTTGSNDPEMLRCHPDQSPRPRREVDDLGKSNDMLCQNADNLI